MPKLSLLILFLFFSSLGCYAQDYSKNKRNSITDKEEIAEPYIWDFGRVKEGEVVKHSFTLKNETAKTMNIKDLTTSCGCTVSKIKEKTLLPGESTSIEVQFNSKGYSGLIQQYVYVNTDNLDASTPSFDKLRTSPERSRGTLGINGEQSRTIDKTVLKFTIKAEVEN